MASLKTIIKSNPLLSAAKCRTLKDIDKGIETVEKIQLIFGENNYDLLIIYRRLLQKKAKILATELDILNMVSKSQLVKPNNYIILKKTVLHHMQKVVEKMKKYE